MSNNDKTRFYTLREAAHIMGCSHRTLRRAIKAGKLVAYTRTDGHKIWIEGRDVDKFTKGQEPRISWAMRIYRRMRCCVRIRR